ncbi:MAG: LCP family protein [Oscillospiraceae bacterium]|nr:LCP family protein [Oscillospiraceae bacterium]
MSEEKNRGGRRLVAGEQKQKTEWTQNLAVWFQNKRNRRITIALAVVLAVILVAAVVLSMLFRKPQVGPAEPPRPIGTSQPDAVGTDGNTGSEPVVPASDRKEDFFTFLVVGRDTAGGGNTDTILLAAYDAKNQTLNVMSIPRDTMVNIPYDLKRINGVYNYNGGGDKGMEALCTEIGQLVGFMPDYHVVVEWKAVGELVDAIGGVEFDVPFNMNYDDNTPGQNLHIHVNKGLQTLDGDKAMQVIRWRKNNGQLDSLGDIGRIEIQQNFLKAVVQECLQFKNVTKIGELAQVFVDNVETDLEVSELLWLAQNAILGGLKMENVNFVTMPYNPAMAWSRVYKNKQSYVTPKGEELVELINEGNFNPYVKDVELKDLDIMRVNKDGSLSSSTGHLEDSRAGTPSGGGGGGSTNTTPVTVSPEPSDSPELSDSPEPSDSPESSDSPSTPPSGSVPPSTSPSGSVPPSNSPSGSEPPTPTPPGSQPPSTPPEPSGSPEPGDSPSPSQEQPPAVTTPPPVQPSVPVDTQPPASEPATPAVVTPDPVVDDVPPPPPEE